MWFGFRNRFSFCLGFWRRSRCWRWGTEVDRVKAIIFRVFRLVEDIVKENRFEKVPFSLRYLLRKQRIVLRGTTTALAASFVTVATMTTATVAVAMMAVVTTVCALYRCLLALGVCRRRHKHKATRVVLVHERSRRHREAFHLGNEGEGGYVAVRRKSRSMSGVREDVGDKKHAVGAKLSCYDRVIQPIKQFHRETDV